MSNLFLCLASWYWSLFSILFLISWACILSCSNIAGICIIWCIIFVCSFNFFLKFIASSMLLVRTWFFCLCFLSIEREIKGILLVHCSWLLCPMFLHFIHLIHYSQCQMREVHLFPLPHVDRIRCCTSFILNSFICLMLQLVTQKFQLRT